MNNINPCPFCGYEVSLSKVNNDYIIKCDHCINSGVSLEMSSLSKEDLLKRWNQRESEIVSCDYNELNNRYFILNDGEVIKCENSHQTELAKIFSIDKNELNNYEELCIKAGIIRLCSYNNKFMVTIPDKFKQIQIDKLIQLLSTLNVEIINIWYDNFIETYHSISDSILRIDQISRRKLNDRI